jgi:hypothetical protein
MNDKGRSRLDLLLDLLADEVAERLQGRSVQLHEKDKGRVGDSAQVTPPSHLDAIPERAEPGPPPHPPRVPPTPAVLSAPEATPAVGPRSIAEGASAGGATPASPSEPAPAPAIEPTVEVVPDLAVPAPSHAAPLMARLALGIFIIVVLINIPLNAQGTALARSIPSSAALVIANGLLVKESNSPDIWVYRDNQFHWITSLDAFDHFGYRWQNVHIVEPGFLNQFEKGNPIYVLLKCDSSPHIYRLEAGRKRWIVDIPTFQAEGYVWQDVEIVPCTYLHSLLDGESIPPGHGLPPPPLP